MKLPKCKQTVSGKHHWKAFTYTYKVDTDDECQILAKNEIKAPKCVFCGLVDDRKI